MLLIAGTFILIRGGTFTSRRDVLDVGGLKITATEERPIEPWLAGAAVVAGAVLIATGLKTGTTKKRL
ncbi:MAG: hypothetical protein ACYC0B_03075 [Gemmatimonadaceae bacterium]